MPYRWFSTYHENNWSPQRGYNELFAKEVQQVRAFFFLERVSFGLDRGVGKWRKYNRDGTTYYARVSQFEWGKLSKLVKFESPEFRLQLELSTKQHQSGVFFKKSLVLVFPTNYPRARPDCIVDSARYRQLSASHDHHTFSNGWMCLTSDQKQWSDACMAVTAINWAVEWIHFHYTTFGF